MTEPVFRLYQTGDQDACLALMDANTPEFFGVNERPDFEAFLKAPTGPYLVLVDGDRVIGCGGYEINIETRIARTTWAMVHPDYKGRGLGKRLFQERQKLIAASGEADRIRVLTSQMTAPFFNQFGFREIRRVKDEFAAGIDLVEMWLDL